MSTRLQVILEQEELEEIRVVAERHRMTVSEWVRSSLREARRREPTRSAEQKLQAVDRAERHSYPTGDIEQILAEIAQGREPGTES